MRSRAGSPARSSLVPSSTCRSIWREKRAEHRALRRKEIAKLGKADTSAAFAMSAISISCQARREARSIRALTTASRLTLGRGAGASAVMITLLRRHPSRMNLCGPRTASPVAPSAREFSARRLAAATASRMRAFSPSGSRHQDFKRRGGRAAGRGHVLAQSRRRKVALEQQLARARHRGAREALGEIGGKAGGSARPPPGTRPDGTHKPGRSPTGP